MATSILLKKKSCFYDSVLDHSYRILWKITWRLLFLGLFTLLYETCPWQAKMFRYIFCKVIHGFCVQGCCWPSITNQTIMSSYILYMKIDMSIP